MTQRRAQYTQGEGAEPEHTHDAVLHSHDHHHVSHHHGGVLTEWQHRTYWHTHDHNHNMMTHSHDYSQVQEADEHAKEAHIHDHAAPVTLARLETAARARDDKRWRGSGRPGCLTRS